MGTPGGRRSSRAGDDPRYTIAGVAEEIREVIFSQAMIAKINNDQHRLTEDDVLHACSHRLRPPRWVYDEERGRRLYIEGKTEWGKSVIVVLYSTGEPGVWRLGTARRED